MLHVLPAARTVPTQPVPLLSTENTVVGEPVVVAVAAPTRKETVPEFRTETVDVVVVPRFTVPNLTGLGESVNCEPEPVPVSDTAVEPPTALCGMVIVAVRDPTAVGVNFTVTVQVAAGAMLPQSGVVTT